MNIDRIEIKFSVGIKLTNRHYRLLDELMIEIYRQNEQKDLHIEMQINKCEDELLNPFMMEN